MPAEAATCPVIPPPVRRLTMSRHILADASVPLAALPAIGRAQEPGVLRRCGLDAATYGDGSTYATGYLSLPALPGREAVLAVGDTGNAFRETHPVAIDSDSRDYFGGGIPYAIISA